MSTSSPVTPVMNYKSVSQVIGSRANMDEARKCVSVPPRKGCELRSCLHVPVPFEGLQLENVRIPTLQDSRRHGDRRLSRIDGVLLTEKCAAP